MDTPTTVDRVFKFGCRPPREHALALQLLGQASNYADDLRRAYNDHKRARRSLLEERDGVHAHVLDWHYEQLKAALRRAREAGRRGHLLDAGTYWLVDAAMQQADKASGLDPIQREPWDATGRVGAAIQSVTQFPAATWAHPRVALTAADGRRHAELTIRVGTLAEGRSITWPVKLHRPFPPGAVVKQVAVQRVRVGHRYRWEALVTVCHEAGHPDHEARGMVGVDIGWRSEGERATRVATHDGDGGAGALLIDTAAAYAYCDAVRGYRDLAFNQVKDHIAGTRIAGGEHARLWKDKARARDVARRGGAGDLGIAMWVERDKHLEDIECGVRARAVRRRLDAFRCYADALAKRYKVVVFEDMPMLDWVGEAETAPMERRRSLAALSLLQLTITHRFGPGRVDWVPTEYTTRTCSACGVVRGAGVGPAVVWTCECGVAHHQDENAAIILRRLGERWSAGGNPTRARVRKSRKKKGEYGKDAVATGDERRMVVTARKPLDNAAE